MVRKPLRWNKKNNKAKNDTSVGEELMSNEEFRNLFLKK
jgi:Lsm interaction motif